MNQYVSTNMNGNIQVFPQFSLEEDSVKYDIDVIDVDAMHISSDPATHLSNYDFEGGEDGVEEDPDDIDNIDNKS